MRILLTGLALALATSGAVAIEFDETDGAAEMKKAIAADTEAAQCDEVTDLALMATECGDGYKLCSSGDGSEWCCPNYRSCGPKLGDCFDKGRSPN